MDVQIFKRSLIVLLIFYIIANAIVIFWENKEKYLSFNYWDSFAEQRRVFYESQYKNKNHSGFIPDEFAYAYTGGALIRGENPVDNIPEAPPLGKYIIGLSAVMFNNPNILIMLVFGLLSLLMIYLTAKQVLNNDFLALIIPAIVVSEPLFRNQFKYVPLFDIAQLFFLFAAFYFYNKWRLDDKFKISNLIFAQLFVGCFISTKFYTSGITIEIPFILLLIIDKDFKRIKQFVFTVWIPVAVLLSTYLRVFAYGYTWNRFLGIQKWIFLYWTNALVLPFTVWDLLVFNKWHTWWGNRAILSDAQWHYGWPIITILSAFSIIAYLFQKPKRNKPLELLLAFAVCYGLFLSVGTPTVRYFVIYLPVLYIIALSTVIRAYDNFSVIRTKILLGI